MRSILVIQQHHHNRYRAYFSISESNQGDSPTSMTILSIPANMGSELLKLILWPTFKSPFTALYQQSTMEITEQDRKLEQAVKQIEKQKEEEAAESSDDETKEAADNEGEKKKKKKKKNKKKKKAADAPEEPKEGQQPPKAETKLEDDNPPTQTNEIFRCLGGWNTPIKIKFPNNQFQGYGPNEIHEYKVPRVKTEELKAKEHLMEETLQNLRKGAEIQRQVRRFAQRIIKPGRRLIDICQELENYNRKLAPEKGLESGIAFPTGCSLNHVAAHYTPNPGDNTVLGYDDVCKIDFGTHIKGRIIDCAFTVAFNPTYDKLLEAVKDATNTGLREAGIDARLGEIGAKIQETMEAYEVEIKGKVYPVKVVRNLNGHSIDPYKIHAGKTVPCVKTNTNEKMEEGEQYAIETFGSTGKGFVREDDDCSHYMKDFYLPNNVKIPQRSKAFYNLITEKYSTLCFAKRWLEKLDFPGYVLPLRDLVQNGIVNTYPPLVDQGGCYVAQWEHTLFLRPTCKEILSRGEDF